MEMATWAAAAARRLALPGIFRSRIRLTAASGLAVALLAAAMTPFTARSAASDDDPGLYVLHSARMPGINPQILRRPYINGIALQVGWGDVEPAEGQYDWSRIDEALEVARRSGKRVTIHLMPLHPPDWVYESGVKTYSREVMNPSLRDYGRTVQQYIPWDPTFLKEWSALTAQFGSRYDRNPVVFAVSVTAPLPEMMIPGSFPPGSPSAQKVREIYDGKAYADAWRQMIDVYGDAFPDKPKFVAPGVVFDDPEFADGVMEYALKRYGDKLWAFNAQLRAQSPNRGPPPLVHIFSLLAHYAQVANLGMQMIWSSSEDRQNQMQGSLRQALANGRQLGARYIEVYEADVLNPDLQEDLAEAGGAQGR